MLCHKQYKSIYQLSLCVYPAMDWWHVLGVFPTFEQQSLNIKNLLWLGKKVLKKKMGITVSIYNLISFAVRQLPLERINNDSLLLLLEPQRPQNSHSTKSKGFCCEPWSILSQRQRTDMMKQSMAWVFTANKGWDQKSRISQEIQGCHNLSRRLVSRNHWPLKLLWYGLQVWLLCPIYDMQLCLCSTTDAAERNQH